MAEIFDLKVLDSNNVARFPQGQLIPTLNDGARALEGILARWEKDTNGSIASSGAANAFAILTNRVIPSHAAGNVFSFRATTANTGASTILINALPIKPLRRHGGEALQDGDIGTNQIVDIKYNSAEDYYECIGISGGGGGGDSLPSGGTTGQVLAKASGDDGDVEWVTAEGTGDMLASMYDPEGVEGDAFDMDNMADGSTKVAMLATERTKLSGIATSATANSADATLLARANHTGTQAISTITGLQTALDGKATTAQGALADSAVQPDDLGTAAAENVGAFATAAQGALADSATQPGDLGDLATKDAVVISDITATGTPSGSTYLRGDGVWETPTGEGGGDVDALFIDQRVTTLHVAEAVGAPIFSGPDGSALHDGFDVLTYVDDENATNLDTSETGALKPTVDSDTSSASTGTANVGTVAVFDRSWTVDNNKTVVSIGVFSAQAGALKVKIALRNSGSSYDSVVDQTVSHGGTGWEDFTLISPYAVPGSGTFYAGARRNTNVDPHSVRSSTSRATFASDLTGAGIAPTAEDTGNIIPVRVTYGANDLSVTSTDINAAEEPNSVRVIARMLDEGGATLNTEVFIDVSRDGGATYNQAAVVEKYTEPGNIRVLDTQDVDVSGQPSGSNLRWRFRTDNGVLVKFIGAAMWGTT